MKKLYTIVWLLMTSLVLSAAEISQEQALENARSFMLQNIEGGGYVIASADDRTLPVLGYTNRWNYLNAKQQSGDLHAIVAAIKKSGIVGNGKWLARGVSKNGMTTAHYAYHYPNEMDAYVPFCAPFLLELQDPRTYSHLLTKDAFGEDEVLMNKMKQSTCHMMFVYGMQDPWTGGQIPNDKMGENSRKLFIQHPTNRRSDAGLHNDYIDQWNFSERAELFKWLNQLGFLANE